MQLRRGLEVNAGRFYILKCIACGYEKQHRGRPARKCQRCGAERDAAIPSQRIPIDPAVRDTDPDPEAA